MASRKRSTPGEVDKHALYKEWDEASCAICMDHPHNAVLLLCSSHDKGCRTYICDTSYRHSNCLDRFRKVTNEKPAPPAPVSMRRIPSPVRFRSRRRSFTFQTSNGNLGLRTPSSLSEFRGELDASSRDALVTDAFAGGSENGTAITNDHMEMNDGVETSNAVSGSERGPEGADADNPSESKPDLRCPLCRGSVLGWKVMEEARNYLDLKPRSCYRESCSFVGNYRELRRHARRVHPTARPADVDPSRERAWQRLEDQREYGDIVSAIHTAMPGAIVLGDYVIENGDSRLSSGRGIGENSRLLSTFFLFQMIGSMDPTHEPRGSRSRALSRYRRSNGPFSRRRFLWGENLGLHYDDDDNDDGNDEVEDEHDLNMSNDLGDNGSNPRRRRRLMRSRSDEDQD
nr:uncharacterized protein LOC109173811 [Ipomoea trifida]